jgi:hypothetical protein
MLTMKKKVFKIAEHEIKFQKEGYLLLPLLNDEEVASLKNFYNELSHPEIEGFHSTHFSKNRAYKKEIHNKITAVFSENLLALLEDYAILFANFMVKGRGESSRMPIHADWTYVDETQFQSLGVWCPLVDTNPQNGMLGVVPKSHLLNFNFRGPKIPNSFQAYDQYIIDTYGKLIPMKAGEIIIYDHRMLHYSPANLSNVNREAINIVAAPNAAAIMHHTVLDDPNMVHVYKVNDPSFFLEYDHFEKPDKGVADSNYLLDIQKMSKDHIDEVLHKRNLLEKIFHLFRAKAY